MALNPRFAQRSDKGGMLLTSRSRHGSKPFWRLFLVTAQHGTAARWSGAPGRTSVTCPCSESTPHRDAAAERKSVPSLTSERSTNLYKKCLSHTHAPSRVELVFKGHPAAKACCDNVASAVDRRVNKAIVNILC
jgi:hypothetical protein